MRLPFDDDDDDGATAFFLFILRPRRRATEAHYPPPPSPFLSTNWLRFAKPNYAFLVRLLLPSCTEFFFPRFQLVALYWVLPSFFPSFHRDSSGRLGDKRAEEASVGFFFWQVIITFFLVPK